MAEIVEIVVGEIGFLSENARVHVEVLPQVGFVFSSYEGMSRGI